MIGEVVLDDDEARGRDVLRLRGRNMITPSLSTDHRSVGKYPFGGEPDVQFPKGMVDMHSPVRGQSIMSAYTFLALSTELSC